MSAARTVSTIFLESAERQVFSLLILEKRSLAHVKNVMDELLNEIFLVTGWKAKISKEQWSGRLKIWKEEWNVNGGGPSPEVLARLDSLPLWREGGKVMRKYSMPEVQTPVPTATRLRELGYKVPGHSQDDGNEFAKVDREDGHTSMQVHSNSSNLSHAMPTNETSYPHVASEPWMLQSPFTTSGQNPGLAPTDTYPFNHPYQAEPFANTQQINTDDGCGQFASADELVSSTRSPYKGFAHPRQQRPVRQHQYQPAPRSSHGISGPLQQPLSSQTSAHKYGLGGPVLSHQGPDNWTQYCPPTSSWSQANENHDLSCNGGI